MFLVCKRENNYPKHWTYPLAGNQPHTCAVVTELRKLGVNVTEYNDAIEIEPVSEILPAEIDTYHDHRIAMSFSLIGTKKPGIKIKNPGCVNKTFPTFFDVLAGLNQ